MIPVYRDESGYAHIVALSGGKDSTAMALRMREVWPELPVTYICTPTGDELPEMFEHWRRLREMLGNLWPISSGTLQSVIAGEKMLPNSRARFCTRKLKLEPFHRFMGANMPCVSYVGLRADEEEREGAELRGGSFHPQSPVEQRYPLREWGWGLAEVMGYLEEKGVQVPERTDCARCFFQRLGEWYLLWRDRPDIYRDAEMDEGIYGHTYRSPSRDTWPASLRELREEFEKGKVPELSLRMMEKRKGMCRACTL